MIITTFVGLAALVVGLLIGWPVLVALSAIFVLVQVMMLTARSVVQRTDRRMEERLDDKRRRRQGCAASVGLARLRQSGTKGRHEMVRELPDETDRDGD